MRLINLFLIVSIFVSCKKEKPEEPVVQSTLKSGMVVLCEGLFQQNNSTVSWVDFTNNVVSNSLFEQKTDRQLGDTGNDMQRYGGKIYIVVSVSSTIEVMDAFTFKSIKQIEMIEGSNAKQPRSIAFNGSKAYVTCYDGFVDVIDTTSLSVIQRISVGLNPEGLTVANNKLYVSNSGGLNAPAMDSTVSVIDLNNHIELQKITVGLNPGGMLTDSYGDVYVISRGDYDAVPSRLIRIDSQSDIVADQFTFDASGLSKMNDKFLVTYYDFSSGLGSVALFNPATELIESANYLNLSNVTTLYGVQFNGSSNKLYVLDAMNFTNTGFVHEYGVGGNYIQNFHVGLNPSKLLFYE